METSPAHLETGIVNVREAKNADINQSLFTKFVVGEEAFEALHSDARLSNNISQDSDVNFGALENVVIFDQCDKPCLDL